MQGDPYWIMTKYAGCCSECGEKIAKVSRAFYFRKSKSLLGEKCGCGTQAAAKFAGEVADEELYRAGHGV